jgi:hypothetical protein
MFFSERFWTITIPRLSEVAALALVAALDRADSHLPPGVFRASADSLHDSRFSWAAGWILADIGAAPGVTLDLRTGFGIVWSEIFTPVIANPNMAQSRGAKIQALNASFTSEHLAQVRAQLKPAQQNALDAGAASVGRTKPIPAPRGRARADRYEAALVRAKLREHQLREAFGVEDMGEAPSAADRRALVKIMSAGATTQQIMEALEGRAAWCREQRMWRGNDTAELYLRLTWICEQTARFDEARAWAPAPPPERTVLRTEVGTFVGGRQVFDVDAPGATPAVQSEVSGEDPLGQWITQRGSKKAD